MSPLHEKLAKNFLGWAARGSGSRTFQAPVLPTPPFIPFPGHRLPSPPKPDDGRRPSFFSRLTELAKHSLQPPPRAKLPEPVKEPEPHWLGEAGAPPVEIRLLLPDDMKVRPETMGQFLSNVSLAAHPLTIELIGNTGQVWLQLAVNDDDKDGVSEQVAAHFPEIIGRISHEQLAGAWGDPDDEFERVVVEFALARPFMLPLTVQDKTDPFVGLVGSLSLLEEEEAGVYQVIFAPLADPWEENAIAAVTKEDGKPYFDDGADLVKAAREKVSRPLYGVVVRLAARAPELDRVWRIIRRMAAPLRLFSRQGGNELTPVQNDDYDHNEHCHDLLWRRCRRSGMILNQDELTGFVRFPTDAVKSEKFLRLAGNTRSVQTTKPQGGVCLGVNNHAGIAEEVWLASQQRTSHMHLIGGTGSGKSTLLFNLIRQDIENGAGFALLDPHGDLAEKVLGIIPQERIDDVIVLDPSDENFIVPFNVLSAHSDFEKVLLASDLVSVFQRLSTSWGDQMNSVFNQAILAFLESTEGGTLADLQRFLLDPKWRESFLKTVNDPDVRYYWKHGFPQLGGGKSIGPILTRLQTFLSPKPIRYMVSQRENRLDFSGIMDGGKILIAKLPQGQMGRENAFLLGSLLVAKMQQTAMSRQRVEASKRRPYFIYIDECHHFLTPSMAETLTSARKYGVGLVLAHQELRQLDRDKEVASALMANASTRIVFRVGDADSTALAGGFAHFESKDIQALRVGEALCRIERADNDFNLRVPLYDDPDENEATERRREVIESSRARYATSRAEVETQLLRQLNESSDGAEGAAPKAKESKTKAQASTKGPPSPDSPRPDSVEESPSTALGGSSESDTPLEKSGPGKGGHQHLLIQERIKTAAEAKGFRAILEMPVGGGGATVDVGLVRRDLKVACEISVTTTVDQEIGNIIKSLREGFDIVAMISADERKLASIRIAAEGCLPPEDFSRIQFFIPKQVLAWLDALSEPASAEPDAPPVRSGIPVKRKFKAISEKERLRINEDAFRVLFEEMRKVGP